jgi:PKD repeat protein
VGDHDAVLSFSAGAVLLSDFNGLEIPDGSSEGVEVTAEVDCGDEACFSDSVGNAYLDLAVDHPGTGDIVIELEAPDGTTAHHEVDGDDELGVNNINSILGSQHIEGVFDSLKAAPISGTWKMRLYDDTPGREGLLYRAVLLLDPARLDLEAGLEAPAVARPDEPFDVGVTIENRGNLNVSSVELTLELMDVETGDVVSAEPLDAPLPMAPGDAQSMSRALSGPQGSFRLRLRAAGLEPDVPPGFHCDPTDISISYRTFASFEVDPAAPSPGQEARMVVLSRGLVDSWHWDFGDQETSTNPGPFHIWHEPGVYVVTLTVSGPDGVSTTARRVSVELRPDSGVDALGGCGCSLPGGEASHPGAPAPALLLILLAAAAVLFLRKSVSGNIPGTGRMEVASPLSGTSARNDSCRDGPSSLSLRASVPNEGEAISVAVLALALLLLAGCDGDGGPEDAAADEAPPSTGPWISLLDPDDPSRGTVPLHVMLSSDDSSACDVTLRYRIDQGEFMPMTLADEEAARDAPSSPQGEERTLEWLSAADVPDDVSDVQIRAEAACGGAASLPVYSRRFMLLNFFEARPHAVLIVEISTADANLPADVQTDYVELVNTTEEAIEMGGWTLMLWATGAAQAEYDLGGLVIEAGDRLLVAGPGSGLQAHLELPEDIGWDIVRGGAVALVADFGRGVDFIRWGGSSALPPEDLQWIEDPPLPVPQTTTVLVRADEAADTDHASDFCLGRPTPAGASSGCIERTLAGDVLITELSSQGTDDEVEVLNRSGGSVNLGGWVVLWDGDEFGEGRIPLATYYLEDGTRLVLRDNGEAGTVRSGVMELGENLNIDGLVPIALALQSPHGDIVDFLAAGGSTVRWMDWTEEHPTPMPGPSTTLSRMPGDPDTDSSADFCLTESNMGRAPEACLEPLGISLRITEVMPGRPDWIEIFNPGADAVDLGSVYLSYTTPFSRSGSYTVEDYLLSGTIEAGALAVASERDIAGITVIPVDINIWLGSDGDASVALRDVYGFGIDYVSWGEPAGMPLWPDVWLGLGADIYETDEDQISLERYPYNAEDTDSRDDWCWAPPSPANPNAPCD